MSAKIVWISTEVSGKHVGRATSSSACAHLTLFASLSLPWRGRALKTAEERSARRTAVSSSRIMILAQRVPALVACQWLRCWSSANTPQCGFVHWYPIIRRAGGALNACASIVRENGKTKRFRWPKEYCRYWSHSASKSTLNRLSQTFTHIFSDSYFDREKKFCC